MATPTSTRPTTLLNPAGLGETGSLIDGYKFGGTWGTGVNLSYSFPAPGTSFFAPNYSIYNEYTQMNVLSPAEKAAVKAALSAWDSLAGVSFSLSNDNANVVGDLRFARTNLGAPTEAAHAATPGFNNPAAGDVWFKNGSWHNAYTTSIAPGTYDYLTVLHEIGHALGLKHPFESGLNNGQTISPAFNSYSYTIMSYTATTQNPGSNAADFFPTTPMWFDILAMQAMYGAQGNHTGNNTYSFSANKHYWQTIDDSAGGDTIVYNGSNGVTINLNIGNWSTLGLPINFGPGLVPQTSTVLIGPRSAIERAIGGSGDDNIVGNALKNILQGKSGVDKLSGRANSDTLIGGSGKDFLTGGPGGDRFDFNSLNDSRPGSARDQINPFSRSDGDKIDLSTIDADIDGTFGNQKFKFIGAKGFTRHDGELRFSNKIVQGDVDGDGNADFEIYVNISSLKSTDFIL